MFLYNLNELPISFKTLDYNDRVINIKSFSKIIIPGLRIGFILVPSPLSTAIMNSKHHTDISSSGLIQRTLVYTYGKENRMHI